MSFQSREEGGYEVVVVEEARLDASLAEAFKNYLFDVIDKGTSALVVDLENVKFMDSSGLGALVAALKKLSGQGVIKLARAQPAVKDLFELTSMETLFPIFASVSDALEGD
ncbi:STAS domain-containing protein [Candidatus Sororendozoicomonas aggregata]|uniref:STAS domain-containing protein n=1 Tax=Candidatus Sororendozoicomonas aggregata TaxID=3073239 RepID=UPI002ED5D74F